MTPADLIFDSPADLGKPDSVPAQRGTTVAVPRLCAGCGVPLSRYNRQSVCGACAHSARGTDDTAAGHSTSELVIGARVAAFRRHAGLTQQQLADRCGLSLALIRSSEDGARTSARVANILALARGLRVPVSALLEPTESPGSLLRAARRRRGWSQSILADRAGLSVSYVSRIENGSRRLASLPTIRRIAAALDVAPVQLVPWLDAGIDMSADGCPLCGAAMDVGSESR